MAREYNVSYSNHRLKPPTKCGSLARGERMMRIATGAADRRLARLTCSRRLLTRRGALAIAMCVGAVPLDSPAHIAPENHESVAIRLASRLTAACCILLACVVPATWTDAAQRTLDQPTLVWMQAVLNNWQAVCRRDLRIATEPLPWIIFYDDNVAWHLQPEKRWLPPHEVSPHPLRFMGETYPLTRVAHQGGRLWVPDREPLPVDVAKPQVAAMPYDDQRKSFFVAPLPGLFHKLAGPDQARNLDEHFLGITAHELTHTRHYAHAMPQITRLRLRYKLPERQRGVLQSRRHLSGDGRAGDVGAVPDGAGAGAIGGGMAEDVDHALGEA
jgi:hypothetical protein